MSKRAQIQQALLKPAFARLYPGIAPNEWQPVTVMLDLVRTAKRQHDGPTPAVEQLLDSEHFELRGTASAGSHDADREVRAEGRKRRRRE